MISGQLLHQTLEPRAIFVSHIYESHGHSPARLDVFHNGAGPHFATRNIKHQFHNGADIGRVLRGDEQSTETERSDPGDIPASAVLPGNQHPFRQGYTRVTTFHRAAFWQRGHAFSLRPPSPRIKSRCPGTYRTNGQANNFSYLYRTADRLHAHFDC